MHKQARYVVGYILTCMHQKNLKDISQTSQSVCNKLQNTLVFSSLNGPYSIPSKLNTKLIMDDKFLKLYIKSSKHVQKIPIFFCDFVTSFNINFIFYLFENKVICIDTKVKDLNNTSIKIKRFRLLNQGPNMIFELSSELVDVANKRKVDIRTFQCL